MRQLFIVESIQNEVKFMILCIDTCTPYAGIAVVHENKCNYKPLSKGNFAESILETIDALLLHADHTKLTGILVLQGPGSFTSLRVGIAVANQFAHQLKIPILPIRAEAFWAHRTDETDFLYLQSMNRDEVYCVGFGKHKKDFSFVAPESLSAAHYLGPLTEAHLQKLPPTLTLLNNLKSIEETWLAISKTHTPQPQKTYDLVEPFYGKEPTITKPKKR